MAGRPLLEVRDLGKRFPARSGRDPSSWVIQGLSFSVEEGEFLTIVGPSGAGKTTLLNMIAQIDVASAGEIRFDSRAAPVGDAKALKPGLDCRIGYVTQDDNLMPWRTTLGNVLFPLEVQGRLSAETRARADMLIRAVGLVGFEKHYPHELSGGMRKRAALARALALDPDLLFLDEPGSGLDPLNAARLDELVLNLRHHLGTAVVMVTHENASIFAVADRALYLDPLAHTMTALGPPRELLAHGPAEVRAFLQRGVVV